MQQIIRDRSLDRLSALLASVDGKISEEYQQVMSQIDLGDIIFLTEVILVVAVKERLVSSDCRPVTERPYISSPTRLEHNFLSAKAGRHQGNSERAARSVHRFSTSGTMLTMFSAKRRSPEGQKR